MGLGDGLNSNFGNALPYRSRSSYINQSSGEKSTGESLLGAIPIVGDVLSTVFGNRARKKEAKAQRKFDLDMWNRQNAYNTPAMQMQRLRDAGLNPALMYGQGTTGNASNQPKATQPQIVNPLSPSAVASGVQVSLMNTQKKLLQSSAFKNYADAAQSKSTSRKIDAMLIPEIRDLQMSTKLKDAQTQNVLEQARAVQSQIDQRVADISLKNMQTRLAKANIGVSEAKAKNLLEDMKAIPQRVKAQLQTANAVTQQAVNGAIANQLKEILQDNQINWEEDKQRKQFFYDMMKYLVKLPADIYKTNIGSFANVLGGISSK